MPVAPIRFSSQEKVTPGHFIPSVLNTVVAQYFLTAMTESCCMGNPWCARAGTETNAQKGDGACWDSHQSALHTVNSQLLFLIPHHCCTYCHTHTHIHTLHPLPLRMEDEKWSNNLVLGFWGRKTETMLPTRCYGKILAEALVSSMFWNTKWMRPVRSKQQTHSCLLSCVWLGCDLATRLC